METNAAEERIKMHLITKSRAFKETSYRQTVKSNRAKQKREQGRQATKQEAMRRAAVEGESLRRMCFGDVHGGPLVKSPPSNAVGGGPSPGWGTKVPHALGQLTRIPQHRPSTAKSKADRKACVLRTSL